MAAGAKHGLTMFESRQQGSQNGTGGTMTGTVLAFIFIGVTVPAATIGAIWLEQRMPPVHARALAAHHPSAADRISPGGG